MRLKNKDIAEQLGISTTAVSLAINGRRGVSEKTRSRVLQLISQSADYGPQRLADAANGTILLSIHKKRGDIINDKPFFSDLVETIQQEALRHGFSTTLFHYLPGQDMTLFLSRIEKQAPEGIIVLATEMDTSDLEAYQTLSLPMVVLDATFDTIAVDSVALDNQASILRAMEYVYRLGHRRIGYLKSQAHAMNFVHRFDGYQKACRELSLPIALVLSLPCTLEGAYAQMHTYLEKLPAQEKLPTVFLADLDYIALGAMRACKEIGMSIPRDISFVGYDDVAACEVCDPPLTTIRVNRADIGAIAVDQLICRIQSPHGCYICTQVSSELVVRESVKDLRE